MACLETLKQDASFQKQLIWSMSQGCCWTETVGLVCSFCSQNGNGGSAVVQVLFPIKWLWGQTRSNCFHWFRHGLLYYCLFSAVEIFSSETLRLSVSISALNVPSFYIYFPPVPHELRGFWIIPLILVWKLCLLLENKSGASVNAGFLQSWLQCQKAGE